MMGLLHLLVGKPDLALPCFEEAFEQCEYEPERTRLVQARAHCWTQRGYPTQALEMVEDWLQEHGPNGDLLEQRGALLAELGEFEASRHDVEVSLCYDITPDRLLAQAMLSRDEERRERLRHYADYCLDLGFADRYLEAHDRLDGP